MDSPTAVRRTHGFRHHNERRIFRRTAFFMETTPLTNAAKDLSVPHGGHFASPHRILDGDNPMVSKVERQLFVEAFHESGAVLVQDPYETNRALLRVAV